MKKYKTFGEFLKYVKENISDASFENVSFSFQDDARDKVFYTPRTLIETIYPIEVIDATVLGLDVSYVSGLAYITIKLLVH